MITALTRYGTLWLRPVVLAAGQRSLVAILITTADLEDVDGAIVPFALPAAGPYPTKVG